MQQNQSSSRAKRSDPGAAGRPAPPGSPRRFAPREDGGGAALVWKRRNPLKSPELDRRNPRKSKPFFLARLGLALDCLEEFGPGPQAGRQLARDRAVSAETQPRSCSRPQMSLQDVENIQFGNGFGAVAPRTPHPPSPRSIPDSTAAAAPGARRARERAGEACRACRRGRNAWSACARVRTPA